MGMNSNVITPTNTEQLSTSYTTKQHKGKQNKNHNPFMDDDKTIFTQTTTTVSLPDVSPYIIDDGIQSFTASTAALYKNTSIQYPQSNATSSKTTSSVSRFGSSRQKQNGLAMGMGMGTRVITPIAVKYLID